LANNESPSRVLERPGHGQIFRRAIGVASVEAEPRVRPLVNNFAFDWGSIRMNIENREENADAFLQRIDYLRLVDLDNVGDASIGSREHRPGVSRGYPLGITK